jgi:hypothetical protein
MEEAKDYAEDTEEVLLTRWEKIKQWFEIAMATKKVAMLLWSLVVGVGGTATVGLVTDTNPLREAALRIGIVETPPIDTTRGMLQIELMDQLASMQQKINELEKHQHNYPDPLMQDHDHPVKKHVHTTQSHHHPLPDHDHPFGLHEHNYADIDHVHSADVTLTPELKAAIMDEVETMLPKDHKKLH